MVKVFRDKHEEDQESIFSLQVLNWANQGPLRPSNSKVYANFGDVVTQRNELRMNKIMA